MKPSPRPTHLRALPSVEKVLQALGAVDLPRRALVGVVRREVASLRRELTQRSVPEPNGPISPCIPTGVEAVVARVQRALDQLRATRIQPVINGTGVLLHTNLGRAPLGPEVVATLVDVASNYCNLEFDLATGERGGRAGYLEHTLALLCGAEAATVVNNCAAALVLLLRHLTRGERKEVVISRGELVQIGGGFRIPDILETSGAVLREIGATNRTGLDDYAAAINPRTALILKVHRSNFFMGGFVASPATEEIAALARQRRVPFVEDLGSGAVMRTEHHGLGDHEPTPAEVLKAGVDLVCFSGDKLLGGPQAGIIAGRKRLVAALKRNAFFRAVRCDKLVLAALQTTVDLHLGNEPAGGGSPEVSSLPIAGLLRGSQAELLARAEGLVTALRDLPLSVTPGRGQARLGGGTLPKATIDSVTIDLVPTQHGVPEFAARLRSGSPPVIGYVSGGRLKLDLRTVFPRQDADLTAAIRQACVG